MKEKEMQKMERLESKIEKKTRELDKLVLLPYDIDYIPTSKVINAYEEYRYYSND